MLFEIVVAITICTSCSLRSLERAKPAIYPFASFSAFGRIATFKTSAVKVNQIINMLRLQPVKVL